MYGRADPAVIDADRHTTDGETRAARHADQVQARALELMNWLRERPLQQCVPPVYGEGAMLKESSVPVGADFAGWVCETVGEVDRCLAEALYDHGRRGRLEARYALARAQFEHPPVADCDVFALFGDMR